MVADCLSRQTWPSTQIVEEMPDALSTKDVIGIPTGPKAKDKDSLAQDRLFDRPLPFQPGGDVGVLSPVPDTPT